MSQVDILHYTLELCIAFVGQSKWDLPIMRRIPYFFLINHGISVLSMAVIFRMCYIGKCCIIQPHLV